MSTHAVKRGLLDFTLFIWYEMRVWFVSRGVNYCVDVTSCASYLLQKEKYQYRPLSYMNMSKT